MSKITLNAAPSLSTVAYYVDQPAGTLSAVQTDAAEVVVGGVHTGTYQAAEPAAYAGILWTDGTSYKYAANDLAAVGLTPATPAQTSAGGAAAYVLSALQSGPQQTITTKFTFGTGDPFMVSYQNISYPVYAGTSSIPQPFAALLIARGLAV